MVSVYLEHSPNKSKKFRVTFRDKTYVDFGATGYSDYTLHGDASRMRNYVSRHGGLIPKETKNLRSEKSIREAMLKVKRSSKEAWGKDGMRTAGFWSRWLLWSLPDIDSAKQLIKDTFDIHIRTRKKKVRSLAKK